MDITIGKERKDYGIFTPQIHHPTTVKPMGPEEGSRMELTQIQRQIQCRACLGRKVSIVELA